MSYPQQDNDKDCGAFVFMVADLLTDDIDLTGKNLQRFKIFPNVLLVA